MKNDGKCSKEPKRPMYYAFKKCLNTHRGAEGKEKENGWNVIKTDKRLQLIDSKNSKKPSMKNSKQTTPNNITVNLLKNQRQREIPKAVRKRLNTFKEKQ